MKKIIFLITLFFLIIVAGCGDSESSDSKEENNNDSANFPEQQIKMIIPYGPGGATDVIFRLAASYAEEHLGETIVPVNMAGAGATTGSREVKNAEPDGYTILASHQAIHTAYLAGIVDYSFEAFEPVTLLTETPNIISAHKDSGWEDMDDLVSAMEEGSEPLNVGHTPGSTDHFFIVQMLEALNKDLSDINLISYEDTGLQVNDLLSQELDISMLNYASGGAYYGDEFVPLGVAHEERLGVLPDAPTFKEQNIDMINSTNRGFFLPKDTPEDIVVKIEQAFKKVMENEEFQKEIEELGSITNFIPHDEYEIYLEDLRETLDRLSEEIDF